MILALIFAWLGYKKANNSGRNGFLWAFIALVTFIGTQLLVGLLIGLVLLIRTEAFGLSESTFEDYEIGYSLFAIAVSFGAGFLVLKYLDRVPVEDADAGPPPPPNFSG